MNRFLFCFFLFASSPAFAGCPQGTTPANVGGEIVCNVVGNAVLSEGSGSDPQNVARKSLLEHDFIVQVYNRGAGNCVEPNTMTGACACAGEKVRDAAQWIYEPKRHKITTCTAGQLFDPIWKLCYVTCGG